MHVAHGPFQSTEELSWLELLEHVGISEDEYLQYGAIWRDIAEADHSASLRQKDQFIFLDDLKGTGNDFALSTTFTWQFR